MAINLQDAYTFLENTSYSHPDIYAIMAQLTEIEKYQSLSETDFLIKEQNGEKLLQIKGQLTHSQWGKIYLQLYYLKPIADGIRVYIINPDPSTVKFDIHYHEHIIDNQLDFSSEFSKGKTLSMVLLNLKTRFENQYPYRQFKNNNNSNYNPNLNPKPIVIQPKIEPQCYAQNDFTDRVPIVTDNTKLQLKQGLKYITDSLLKDWQRQGKFRDQLVEEYQSSQRERAILISLLKEIKDKSETLKNEAAVMNEFLSQHSDLQVNENNILSILDMGLAESQICELSAEIFAIKDTYKYIQQKFLGSTIKYESLLSSVKQLADQEFNNSLLLKKCKARLSIQ